MESREKKYNCQIEINDLIDDAIKNAVERRNQDLSSEDALSDEEMKNIAGGIFQLPTMTTMGIIAVQDKTLLA